MTFEPGRIAVVDEAERALWMPPGSVRAIMALTVLGVTLWMWATGTDVTQAQEIITGGVVGAYFYTKQQQAGKRVEAKVEAALDSVDLMRQTVVLDARDAADFRAGRDVPPFVNPSTGSRM